MNTRCNVRCGVNIQFYLMTMPKNLFFVQYFLHLLFQVLSLDQNFHQELNNKKHKDFTNQAAIVRMLVLYLQGILVIQDSETRHWHCPGQKIINQALIQLLVNLAVIWLYMTKTTITVNIQKMSLNNCISYSKTSPGKRGALRIGIEKN